MRPLKPPSDIVWLKICVQCNKFIIGGYDNVLICKACLKEMEAGWPEVGRIR